MGVENINAPFDSIIRGIIAGAPMLLYLDSFFFLEDSTRGKWLKLKRRAIGSDSRWGFLIYL